MACSRLLVVVLGLACVALPAPAAAQSCDSLARVPLRDGTVTAAEVVGTGTFVPPGGRGGGPAPVFKALPEFCRVSARLTPTSDSDIRIEVWLPARGWNGRFQAVGNGGWAGSIPYAAMAQALAGGYATAGTDTGHTGNNAAFTIGHPEKVIDFGYRAVREMTVQAKALIAAYYGAPPRFSIWNGCSQGGRQGISAALRYPEDFDAVIAGAPAVNWMHLHAGRMTANRYVNRAPDSGLAREQYELVHTAVLAACDGHDGVSDGVIENPAACRFDPQVLECGGSGSAGACLTPAQVESVRSLYAPVRHPRTGSTVLPGLAPGSELGWAVAASPEPVATAIDAFRYVFQDPAWTADRFVPATDIDRTLHDPGDVLATTSTDLGAFFGRGGKLLLYHGWSDPQVTPYNTINYFGAVVERFGPQIAGRSIELYMVPGMNHCQGGAGTDRFDVVAAVENWMAAGTAPRRIEASRQSGGVVDRTRPLCPFGQVARWSGAGSTDDAANFACVPVGAPPR